MLKIALLSSFNADLLSPRLSQLLQESSIETSFYVAGFAQYQQEILNPDSGLYRARPDLIILLLDSQDVFADLIQHPLDFLPEQQLARIEDELSNLHQYIELLHTRLPGTILFLNTLVAPPRTSLGLLEHNSPYSVRGVIARYNIKLSELARQKMHSYIVDCEALAAEIGWKEWNDDRLWLLGRMRLSRQALEALAGSYSSAVRALHGNVKKVLVLDADNTLWGGTIGTDGVGGIQIGYEGIGLAYQQFQAEILNLYKRGIILALVSKNNQDDVYEALDTHPTLLLRREHFAACYINWQDKVTNLRDLAEQLNLGLESFVFVDDSSFECAWVQDQLPEVQVLHLPQDPAEFVRALRGLDAFATLVLTHEDLTRGKLYRAQQQHKELRQASGSLQEFYVSLEMHAIIRPLTPATLARAAQMTQKTNQFNLTTRRYTEADIRALAEQPGNEIYTLVLSDRFGDQGIVGIAILIWEGETARLDTLLLSCRAMGRALETAFIAVLANCARAHNARYLLGEFLPGKKNMPVRDFYRQNGFAPLDTDGHWWRYDLLADNLTAPDFITLDFPGR
ncbi:MAG TPA: HAD-IIIC family phosphatase [Ktedonobacteraceae bacterium]|nr:HAD-IIIC family phosphatase [Ktedonobacteraceae bacterium]